MVVVLLEGLVATCRRMLSVEDHAAIMVGLEAGLSGSSELSVVGGI